MPNPTINNYIFYAKKIKKCKKEMVQQKKKDILKMSNFDILKIEFFKHS